MEWREVPDLLLLLYPCSYPNGLQVYGLGYDGYRGFIFKKLLSFDRVAHFGSGFAVSGTKLYAVGNVDPPYNEFKAWDLTKWWTEDVFPEERGKTLGNKPFPVVFEFDDRIYALAGMGFSIHLDPVFEVFDPSVGRWKRLSDPPFIKDYSTEGIGPRIKSHTLIGKTLFVALLYYGPDLVPQESWRYFAYDVESDTWEPEPIIDPTVFDYDLTAQNFLMHCQMQKIDHVDDNMMVFTCRPNMGVYACDLNSHLEELATLLPLLPRWKKAKIDRYCASTVSDAIMSPRGSEELGLSYAFLPVFGFESIAKQLPKCRSNNQMVAHLSENIYCLVYFYVPCKKECQKIHVVVFEALKWTKEEGCLRTKILAESHFDVDSIMSLEAWCKIKFSG